MGKISSFLFYLMLVVFGGFALLALFLLRYQPLTQFLVIILLAAFYFAVGVVYHMIRGDLTKNIVLEFGGIAVLAILSFAMLTFWRLI